jgi:RNA polymerase sigma-70 factor (ECF subfamily)
MIEPVAGAPVQTPANPQGKGCPGDEFVCAFNEARTELVSTLYFFLGNYEDAQDAVQEGFLKCWRARAGLPEVQNLRAWIYRVCLNSAKDLQRNAWRRRARPLSGASGILPAEGSSPEQAAEYREEQERLRVALLDLRPEEKEVFLLRQNAALTYEEIAALRRSPVGTVKTQMRSAVAKLRLVLGQKPSD